MADSVGTFAGKMVFGSVPGGGKVYYLTTYRRRDHGAQRAELLLLGMAAASAGLDERFILYKQPGGELHMQTAEGLWVALHESLGWLMPTKELSQAADCRLTGSPVGQVWEVKKGTEWARVSYSLDQASPLVTINDAPGALKDFAPTEVAPGLDTIRAAKQCREGDLRHVTLAQEDLSGIDFTEAHFEGSDLTGVVFDRAILTQAHFGDAALSGISCNDATLDEADFSEAHLEGVSWGKAKRAQKVVLTDCHARGATLGGKDHHLDCTGADLTSGDFRDADLTNLVLTGAQAGGAILAGCHLDGAKLDGGNLSNAIATDAHFMGASLVGVTAQGASFVRADLSSADLTRAKMGAKAYLWQLNDPGGKLAGELDQYPYPRADLMAAFKAKGVTLHDNAPVSVLTKGERWEIADPQGPYLLIAGTDKGIDVFNDSPDLRPAILRRALCQHTKAPSACLSGADLRGVRWYDDQATLDHADLEDAALSGSLLVKTDFTQARLAGADLSGSVMVEAKLHRCLLGPGRSRRAVSLEGALIQQTDFSEATLLGAVLVDAAVALPLGVPLLTLPLSDKQYLNSEGLSHLAPAFNAAGYPLGANPQIEAVKTWLIDNHKDTSPRARKSYRVELADGELKVYDGSTQGGSELFDLPGAFERLLTQPPPQALVLQFMQHGYSLSSQAAITCQEHWAIRPDPAAPIVGLASYPKMLVYAGESSLRVYGSVLVKLRDWSEYPAGVAFGATVAIEDALCPTSLGPNGAPRAWVDEGLLDWETLMTATRKGASGSR